MDWRYFQGVYSSAHCDETILYQGGKWQVWVGGRITGRFDELAEAKGSVESAIAQYWLSKIDY